jgi:hypothetical protein
MTSYLATIRKLLVALVGVVAQAVSLGVLSGRALEYAQIIIAVATALGVYVVGNADAPDAKAPVTGP